MKSTPSRRDSMTPLMRQYQEIKAKYPGKIIFFRMGDFYEMFGDDAVKAAPILNIALTSRGHGNGEKIPLAGVPHHSADKYLARLLAAGEKVVIVEQIEDPRQAKGVVKRGVVEVLTPGTATVEGVVEETGQIYLAALYYRQPEALGLAYIDLMGGRFFLEENEAEMILEKIKVLSPQEILFPQNLKDDKIMAELENIYGRIMTPFEEWHFDYGTAVRELCQFLGSGLSTVSGSAHPDSVSPPPGRFIAISGRITAPVWIMSPA